MVTSIPTGARIACSSPGVRLIGERRRSVPQDVANMKVQAVVGRTYTLRHT